MTCGMSKSLNILKNVMQRTNENDKILTDFHSHEDKHDLSLFLKVT